MTFPIEKRGDGVRFRVRVQPRASVSAIAGVFDDALKVRLAAPPVDGAANEELVALLAHVLGVARSRITIVSGHTGRSKTVEVADITAEHAHARLLDAS